MPTLTRTVVTAKSDDAFNRFYSLADIALWLDECRKLSEALPDSYLPWMAWQVRVDRTLQVTVEGPYDQSPSE